MQQTYYGALHLENCVSLFLSKKVWKNFLVVLMVLPSLHNFSQENFVTISFGYSFSNFEVAVLKGIGYINNWLYDITTIWSIGSID